MDIDPKCFDRLEKRRKMQSIIIISAQLDGQRQGHQLKHKAGFA